MRVFIKSLFLGLVIQFSLGVFTTVEAVEDTVGIVHLCRRALIAGTVLGSLGYSTWQIKKGVYWPDATVFGLSGLALAYLDRAELAESTKAFARHGWDYSNIVLAHMASYIMGKDPNSITPGDKIAVLAFAGGVCWGGYRLYKWLAS